MAKKQIRELGNMLAKFRSEHGISQEDVAHVIGVTQMAISNIERGISIPRRTTFMRLKEFLAKHGYFVKEEAA